MRTQFTPKQKTILQIIRNESKVTAMWLSETLGSSKKVLHHLLNDMTREKYGCCLQVAERMQRSTGGRLAPVFELSPFLKFMSDFEFQEAIQFRHVMKSSRPEKAEKLEKPLRANQGLLKEVIKSDAEKVALIKMNAPFFSCVDVGRAIGASPEAVKEVAKDLGIDFSEETRHPSSDFIISTMRFIPSGTEVIETEIGTTFHIPTNIPGIPRVTRHFAAT